MSISNQNFIKQFSSSITCKADGIYYADSSEAISYPESGNDDCFEIEENSFWFRQRNDCIIEIVKNSPPIMNGPIFDIGGGNGFVAKGLMNAGWDTVVVEPGASGARNAKKEAYLMLFVQPRLRQSLSMELYLLSAFLMLWNTLTTTLDF